MFDPFDPLSLTQFNDVWEIETFEMGDPYGWRYSGIAKHTRRDHAFLAAIDHSALYIVGGIEEEPDKHGMTGDLIKCTKDSNHGAIRCQVTKNFFFDKGLRKRMTSPMAIAVTQEQVENWGC